MAEHTGRTGDQVRHDTERDLNLAAQQALDHGVIDASITRSGQVRPGPDAIRRPSPPGH